MTARGKETEWTGGTLSVKREGGRILLLHAGDNGTNVIIPMDEAGARELVRQVTEVLRTP